MSTVTGDFVVNFVTMTLVDPYTNSNIIQLDALAPANAQVKIANAVVANVLIPSSHGGSGTQFGFRRFLYSGNTVSTGVIRSKIEINRANSSDVIYLIIAQANGAGYYMPITSNTAALGVQTRYANGTIIDGLGSNGTPHMLPGDQVIMERWFANGMINCYWNSNLLFQVANSAFTTGLTFGWGFDAENNNSSSLRSIGGDGVASSGGGPTSLTFKAYANGDIQANTFIQATLPTGIAARFYGPNNTLHVSSIVTTGAGKIKFQSNGQLVCNNTIVF